MSRRINVRFYPFKISREFHSKYHVFKCENVVQSVARNKLYELFASTMCESTNSDDPDDPDMREKEGLACGEASSVDDTTLIFIYILVVIYKSRMCVCTH